MAHAHQDNAHQDNAHQHTLIQGDGEGNVQERFTQMLDIYAALNGDFAVNGFADYSGFDYVTGTSPQVRYPSA